MITMVLGQKSIYIYFFIRCFSRSSWLFCCWSNLIPQLSFQMNLCPISFDSCGWVWEGPFGRFVPIQWKSEDEGESTRHHRPTPSRSRALMANVTRGFDAPTNPNVNRTQRWRQREPKECEVTDTTCNPSPTQNSGRRCVNALRVRRKGIRVHLRMGQRRQE